MQNFINLKNKFDTINNMGWIKSKANGQGAVGLTFEKLLNKEVENFEIPDYEGIEIKVNSTGLKGYMSLFNATPDSYLFEIKRLYKLYGYPDIKNKNFNVFNASVYCTKRISTKNNFDFKLKIDKISKQIFLLVFDSKNNLIDTDTAWSFDIINEKLTRKLSFLAIIDADKKNLNGHTHFRYKKICFYKLKSFDTFINLLEKGYIRISFRIGTFKSEKKYGQIYDHGTNFNISKKHINKLYELIEI